MSTFEFKSKTRESNILYIVYFVYFVKYFIILTVFCAFFFQENSIALPEFTAFYQNILPWPEAITLKLFLRFVKK